MVVFTCTMFVLLLFIELSVNCTSFDSVDQVFRIVCRYVSNIQYVGVTTGLYDSPLNHNRSSHVKWMSVALPIFTYVNKDNSAKPHLILRYTWNYVRL